MKKFLVVLLFCFLIQNGFSEEENPSNVLQNWNFEKNLSSWSVPDWIKTALKPELDSTVFKEGQSSVSFKAENGKKVFLMQSVKRDPEISEYILSVWVKSKDSVNFNPFLMLEAVSIENGKEKYTDVKVPVDLPLSAGAWTKIEKKIKVPDSASQIRIMLMSDADVSKPSSGSIWFDCCQLEEVIPQRDKIIVKDIIPGGRQGIFQRGEKPSLSILVTNSYAEDKNAELEISVQDYYGKSVLQKTENLNLIKQRVSKKEVQLDSIDKSGFYSVSFAIKINKVPFSSETGSFVMVEPIGKPDPFFGICQYNLRQDYIKTARLMGCGSAGVIIQWRNEFQKGKFNWEVSDAQINEFISEGMKIIGQFNLMGDHYSQPQWVLEKIRENKKKGIAPYTEEYYKDMAAFEKMAVARYKNSISEWSVINEIDLSMHKDAFEKDHYIRAVKELYPAMKSVNPAFDLGGIGVSGCDGQKNPRFPAAEMLWETLHDSLDGMAYDTYVDPKTYGPGYTPIGPERGNFREILLQSVALVKKYGKKFISIDEKGDKIISTLPVDSIYARQMAEALVRSYIIARSVPENRHWLYFIFKGAQEGTADYGLWRSNCPRPTVAAYATVARRLAHVSDPVVVELNKDIYCFVFAKGKGMVAAIWTISETPVIFDFDVAEDSSGYDIMNNSFPVKKGKQQFSLSKSPLFIESGVNSSIMVNALKKASFMLPELKGEIRLRNLLEISVFLANNSNKKLDVSIVPEKNPVLLIEPDKKSLEINPASMGNANFNIVNSSFELLNGKNIEVAAVADGVRKYMFSYKPELMKVERLRTPVKIDGDISEFKNIKPVIMDNPSFLFPADAIPNKLWTGPEDLSCKVYLAYDTDNFYFAAEVVDDVKINEKEGYRMWSNDSFQIAFDTMNDALSGELSKNVGYDSSDYEFGIALTPKGPECFCYVAGGINKTLENKTTPFKVMVKKSENGNMIYELAIPWQSLAPLKPVPGSVFGFNMICLDSDEPGKTSLYWMGLAPGIADGKKPHEFKTMVLMP